MSVDVETERQKFEAAMLADGWIPMEFARDADGNYVELCTADTFNGWLAAKRYEAGRDGEGG
jgi:hypothetical protein